MSAGPEPGGEAALVREVLAGLATAETRYEVLALRYASGEVRRREVFAQFDLYEEADGPMPIAYYVWVLRGGGHTYLVDAGIAPAVGARRGQPTMELPGVLGQVGVATGDVEAVAVTHMHWDHIGRLDLFPAVPVHVQRRELEFWHGPLARPTIFSAWVEPEEVARLDAAREEGRLRLLAPRAPVFPGVTGLLVGGHSPGLMILVVNGIEGPVVLASDAIHFYELLERERPVSIISSTTEILAGFRLLREFERVGATLISGHDPAVLARGEALSPDVARVG